MNFLAVFSFISLALSVPLNFSSSHNASLSSQTLQKAAPKVFVVTLFELEEEAWLQNVYFQNNFTIPGLSPVYPYVHCTTDFELCHVTTGEGEINAASSMMAVLLSPYFDLTETFWVTNGIAGGDPNEISFGSVTFAKYAIQVALQYEVDSRELVNTTYSNWTSGYWGFGNDGPDEYPGNVYGTEVFELNENLRDKAMEAAKKYEDKLDEGNSNNTKLRDQYQKPGSNKPMIKGCDVVTSDVYFTGKMLDKYFSDYVKMITNDTATYCSTAQEDNAILEVFVRMDKAGLVRFDRIIVMRSISDYAEPPSNYTDPVTWFNTYPTGGIEASLTNLYTAASAVVQDILENYDNYTEIEADNYYGDIFGTLGGTMDFGLASYEIA